MKQINTFRGGFALPTVLIASIVMLMIMAVSVTSVVSVRTALKSQYYGQLAKAAGEAGVAYAKACLAKNGNVALWTDAKPLTPSTDCAGNEMLQPQIQVLVVAGGGGGGGWFGGGGGGGGVVMNNNFSVTPQTHSVVIGSGGAGGGSGTVGTQGGLSSFGALAAIGGGGGGARTGTGTVANAPSGGGSGGGGAGTLNSSTTFPGPGGTGTSGQGYNGGSGSGSTAGGNGGGGGGAGAAGTDASGTTSGAGYSGAGGNGYLSDISGSPLYYGGGGSGGRFGTGTVGLAGLTGAGMGGNNTSTGNPAVPNSGGGGGGGGTTNAAGGGGGSGVVIVRYPANGSVTATGSNTTATTEGSYKVLRFTASGNFTVSAVANSSCPTDPRCSVTSNSFLRSSFKVTAPTLNSEGQAIAIPNTGYVELLRESTGTVWRTYKQPSVQAAVVPDFCSGQASSALGWGNAVKATEQQSIVGASAAETITLAATDLNSGATYFRKDFPTTSSDTYAINVRTTSPQDTIVVYVDGVLRLTGGGTLSTANVTLDAGCHSITVRLVNQTLVAKPSSFTLALQKSGGSPITATDTSWRVSAGGQVHFSQSDFYVSSSLWGLVQNVTAANTFLATWTATTTDSGARFISAPASTGCAATCPANNYQYYRDNDDVTVAANTRVQLSAACDDSCVVYLDGNPIITSATATSIGQQTFTLTKGTHHLGVRVSNGTAGTSGMALTLINLEASNAVLARSDANWAATNALVSNASTVDVYGFENSFRPSPNDIP